MSGKAIRGGKAEIEVGLNRKGLEKGLKAVQRSLRSAAKMVGGIGAAMATAGSAISAPLLATISTASDFQETMSKFDTVFGSNAAAMKTWGDTFAKQVGRSKGEVAGFLAEAQDTFVPLGFDPAEAEAMSKQLAAMSVDLASFNNMGDREAFDRLLSAMVGNTENLRAFGVVAQDAQIKAQAMAMGFDPKALTPYQKALAVMELTVKGTTAAQGDATRTAGSFANRMKRLKATVTDAATAIGTALLPIATKFVDKAGALVAMVGDWISRNQKLVMIIGGVGAALTIAGSAGIGFAGVLAVVSTAVGILGTIAAAVFSPIGLTIAGIAIAAGGLAFLIYRVAEGSGYLGKIWETLSNALNRIMEIGKKAFAGIRDSIAMGDWKGAIGIAFAGMKVAWFEGLATITDGQNRWIQKTLWAIGGFVHKWVEAVKQGATSVAKIMANPLNAVKVFKDFNAAIVDAITPSGNSIHDWAKSQADAAREELGRLTSEAAANRELSGIDDSGPSIAGLDLGKITDGIDAPETVKLNDRIEELKNKIGDLENLEFGPGLIDAAKLSADGATADQAERFAAIASGSPGITAPAADPNLSFARFGSREATDTLQRTRLINQARAVPTLATASVNAPDRAIAAAESEIRKADSKFDVEPIVNAVDLGTEATKNVVKAVNKVAAKIGSGAEQL